MSGDSGYLLGETDRESQRLTRQAALFEPETDAWLRRAGLAPGMRVLELGSGLGDVTILASRIVRPDGAVLGVERSPASIEVAQQRVAALGNLNAAFECADLGSYTPHQSFDALIGRFVLGFLDDPATILRRMASAVRPGGIVAMIEFDVRQMSTTPHSPLFHRTIDLLIGAFEGMGVDPGLGSDLAHVFRMAGLPFPRLTAIQYAAAGNEEPLWYFAELLRSVAPHVERLGLATAEEIGLDTLDARLSEEAARLNLTAFLPRWVCGWVRKPSE
jgi:SAM-dependent methyltransferase